MRVVVTRDPEKFAAHAGQLLARHIEHNVLATVLATLEPGQCTSPPLFAWVEAGRSGEVAAAALRTPPRRLLASLMTVEAADALMGNLIEADPQLPGVIGPLPAASYLAEAWRHCTGGTVKRGMSLAIHWLARVDEPPHGPSGHLRPANPSERDLLVQWTRAFSREASVESSDAETSVDRRLRHGGLFVWDAGGVVSMVATSQPVAGVVRLGPVYTPPDARRHGYATALVAGVSGRALAAGATKCMLYTDLANPTSNCIYRAVGYRHSSDAREYIFVRREPV